MGRFSPAIVSALRGYRRDDFLADLGAGLTVGLIALPLAIGFGIASGVTPQQGLWTGIIASLVVALLGGSRFQVAGPTGAFVPVLFSVVAMYGYGGLALATMMAGVMLILLGALRMGKLLKFFPYPVVAGFTSGIAVIIFCGQLNEFLGLGLKMPGHVPQQIAALASHLHSINWQAFAIGALTLGILYAWPLVTRRVPASIVAVVVATLVAYFAGWPVATIDSRFGGIPAGLPGLHFPTVSLEAMRDLMGPAFTIAALGAIESLLSAVVADGMTDTRHDPNQELMAQGIANVLCPIAGGIPATGAIARTAANIRTGARTPVSAIVHALVLLAVVFLAAPLAGYIPLAALSAILLTVALRMAELHTFVELWRGPRADFGVLVAAFALTVVFDLTIGVGAGLIMAVVLFLRQMEEVTHVRLVTAESEDAGTGSHSIRGKDIPSGRDSLPHRRPHVFCRRRKARHGVARLGRQAARGDFPDAERPGDGCQRPARVRRRNRKAAPRRRRNFPDRRPAATDESHVRSRPGRTDRPRPLLRRHRSGARGRARAAGSKSDLNRRAPNCR